MSSIFDAIFAIGREVLQQQHGEAVTWHKMDGSTDVAVSNAILGPEASEPRDTDRGVVIFRVRTLEIPTATVADPNRGDSVTIDGVEWGYDRTLAIKGGLAHVQVCRPEQAEITAGEYRRR